jgi:hypothetical protein
MGVLGVDRDRLVMAIVEPSAPKPKQPTETVEEKKTVVEEIKETLDIKEELSGVNSLEDVRNVVSEAISEGLEKIREAGTEPYKEATREIGKNVARWWRRAMDGKE